MDMSFLNIAIEKVWERTVDDRCVSHVSANGSQRVILRYRLKEKDTS